MIACQCFTRRSRERREQDDARGASIGNVRYGSGNATDNVNHLIATWYRNPTSPDVIALKLFIDAD